MYSLFVQLLLLSSIWSDAATFCYLCLHCTTDTLINKHTLTHPNEHTHDSKHSHLKATQGNKFAMSLIAHRKKKVEGKIKMAESPKSSQERLKWRLWLVWTGLSRGRKWKLKDWWCFNKPHLEIAMPMPMAIAVPAIIISKMNWLFKYLLAMLVALFCLSRCLCWLPWQPRAMGYTARLLIAMKLLPETFGQKIWIMFNKL